MKKYILRKKGWVFNDSTYEEDLELEFEGIYDDYEKALDRKKYLDRLMFVSFFDRINCVETWNTDIKNTFYNYLAKELAFNPTIYLHKDNSWLSTLMFATIPTDKELDDLIDILKIDFFYIVEIEGPILHFYHAKENPYYDNGNEYLGDYHGNKKLVFNTKKEAIIRYYKEHHHLYEHSSIFNKPLEEVSDTPDLLQHFIQQHKHFHYSTIEGLMCTETINQEDFITLNGLLKHPFVLLEPVPTKEIPFIQEDDIQELNSEIWNNEWKYIVERENNFSSVKGLKNSDDYFLSFMISFDDIQYYPHHNQLLTIVENHLIQYIPKEKFIQYGKLINFDGIILEMTQAENTYFVSSSFRVNHAKLDTDKKSNGQGKTVLEAFENSLDNFLKEYIIDWVEQIKNM